MSQVTLPRPRPPRHNTAAPIRLTSKITFVVVHGTAAEELIKRQGAAVRDALEWFAHHPPDEADG